MAETKEGLRRRIRDRMRGFAAADRARASQALCGLLTRQKAWQDSRQILLFMPMADEPDIYPLLELALAAGKAVCYPRYSREIGEYEACRITDPRRDLAPGRYQIAEPVADCPIFPRNQLDFVLVPGVGFDEAGHRLGRGKGYYDRLLVPVRGIKCGVAFEEQIVEEVPIESHDLKLDCILTPIRCFFASGGPV